MKPNNYVSKSIKIFHGSYQNVETAVNEWLADSDIIIRWITQSESTLKEFSLSDPDINLTIFYTESKELDDAA
jgi:hypothetical protein